MVTVSEAIAELDALFDALAEARANAVPVPIELMIVCPDCGKNPPFRNRCPKCGGDSWIPAGPVSGIFEWVKARHWRRGR